MSHTSVDASFEVNTLVSNQIEESDESILKLFNKRFHTIKKCGLVLMVLIVCLTPGLVIITSTPHHIHQHEYIEMNDIIVNQTACGYIKQFDLLENIYLTVCNRDNFVLLDIRRFFNQTASIQGIGLNIHQWSQLKKLLHLIDTAISKSMH
ncbi:hypothetical protein ACF0H5_019394 [Mactra antiquata]